MKQKLILLHGALGSQALLEPLKETLKNQFEVFSFDFQGHGENQGPEAFSIDAFSNNVLEFMAENKIDQSHFFGYSMGGYVALTFAKSHPEKVGKIVSLGTKFNWTPESSAEEIKKLNADNIEEKVPAFAEYLASIHGKENWKNVVARTADMMHELGNGKALKTEDFGEINHNIQLLLAEHDSMVTLHETELVQIALPNAELKIVSNAKHPLETVEAKVLCEILSEFILN